MFLVRDKNPQQPKSPHADEVKQIEDEKVTKEIDELSKMTDSGAAAVILKDLKKFRSESPTLDPRNAAMTPSATLEPLRKPRYESPFFACTFQRLEDYHVWEHLLILDSSQESCLKNLDLTFFLSGVSYTTLTDRQIYR